MMDRMRRSTGALAGGAWFLPSVAKVRTTQDRGYLENIIGDLKARMSLENINTLERQA
jgi:hypothetical protein